MSHLALALKRAVDAKEIVKLLYKLIKEMDNKTIKKLRGPRIQLLNSMLNRSDRK